MSSAGKPGLKGKRNVDGYQAIWEHVNGRPMVYPKPRYNHPILMDPANYDYRALEGVPGVEEKLFGIFSESRTEAGILRFATGAGHEVSGRGIYFVITGAGEVGGQPFRSLTTVFLDRGETASFTSTETAEILHMGLPDLAALKAAGDARQSATVAAVAAE